MAKTVKARPGDSLCNIAFLNGFPDCTKLRADPANAAIVNRAVDPAQLRPGDVVTVPDITLKDVKAGTEAKHKFKKRGDLAILRFVHGSASAKIQNDLTLRSLEISNYITNLAGSPDGQAGKAFPAGAGFNADADKDIDAFKVEIFDLNEPGGTLKVKLEVLRPKYDAAGTVTGHESFPGAIVADRKLNPDATKQGTSHRFRTPYLRLVVDDKDKAAAPAQTLLVADMVDAGDKKVELLDQVVRAAYEVKTCPNNPKCKSMVTLPIGRDRRRLRVAVHVLRGTAGGAPIVTTANAERRILMWLRRAYAQISISPKLVTAVREVDPPENLLAVANDSGLTANGDGNIQFRLNAPGKAAVTVGPYTPKKNDKPIKTANALKALITAPYSAVVSENPARFPDPVGRKSADLVITEASGARVTITILANGDSRQKIQVGRPKPLTFQEWDGNNWLVGTIEQRTILKNYDTGDDRVDLFVIKNFISPTLLGAAMMSGHKVDPQRRAISKVKWSAFVDIRSSDGTDGFPHVIPHEMMHVVGEVMHATVDAAQIMNPTAQPAHNVGDPKRIRDGAVTYDGGTIAGSHNLVRRMRTEGASLLENW